MSRHKELAEDLEQAGAEREELPKLLSLAEQLRCLPAPSYKAKELWRWSWPKLTALSLSLAVVGLIAGGGVVAAAQSSNPQAVLYPVKRASEHVAMMVNPNFYDAIMRRRVSEINSMVLQHDNEDVVTQDVKDYMKMVSGKHYIDPATRDFCLDSLQQAEQASTGEEHATIAQAYKQMDSED